MRARLRVPLLRVIAMVSRPWVGGADLPGEEGRLRILVIRPDHLGDVLFVTPALRALRAALPEAHIACLVGPWSAQVVSNNPHLDEVLICPFPGFARQPKKNVLEPYLLLRSHARALRFKAFDVALVMRFDHWWGAMLAYWAAIPRRIGYDLPPVTPFLTERVAYPTGSHEVEQNMRLVTALLGKTVGQAGPLEFHPQAEAVRSIRALLGSVDDGRGLLCLHPGAGAPVKLWRPEGFAEVGDSLARKYGLQVLITGSADERRLAEEISTRMNARPLVMAGQTTLDELAALMAQCRLVIGVDSGPLHLAVSQGVPTIHLFGPTDHRLFGPWGDTTRHVVITGDMECAPCNRLDYLPHELLDHPCVRSIPASKVLAVADSLLTSDSDTSERDGIMASDTGLEGDHVR